MRRRAFLELLVTGVARYAVRPSVALTAQRATWHERLSKIELHLHLEGALPRATLWELITKYGADPAIKSREDLDRVFVYSDFGGFLRTFVWMMRYVREYDDYTLIGEAVARDLARQNIRYVEAFFSPPEHRRAKLDPQRVTEALRKGLNRVASIEVALVPDLVRDRGVEHAGNLLERMGEVKNLGVIGIGIGGFEPTFPPELFEATYERARALGFRTTAHAGEAAGAASMWGAVRALRVDRIGHATRAIEDPELVKHLAARRIPLELCPLSNVRTGVIKSVEEHPLRSLFRRGYSSDAQHATRYGGWCCSHPSRRHGSAASAVAEQRLSLLGARFRSSSDRAGNPRPVGGHANLQRKRRETNRAARM